MIDKRDSEFTDLTRAQVGALLECFDFVHNGYEPIIDYCSEDKWVIQLRHRRTSKRLGVYIYQNFYYIRRGDKVVKTVTFKPSPERFKAIVNSDMSVGVLKLSGGVSSRVVFT